MARKDTLPIVTKARSGHKPTQAQQQAAAAQFKRTQKGILTPGKKAK